MLVSETSLFFKNKITNETKAATTNVSAPFAQYKYCNLATTTQSAYT